MDLFTLSAKLRLDASKFQSGINQAENAGNSLSEKMSGMFNKIESAAKLFIGGAAINKAVGMVRNLADETAAAGDRIDKQSQILGMSRKAYQEWDYILSQNGVSIDNMSVAMKTLNNLVLSGIDDNKEAKEAFAELGISIHQLENMTPEEQFEFLVRKFQEMPAGAKKTALAMKVFGKQGQQMMPLLNNTTDSIDEMRERAQELGLIMSDEAVDSAVAYGDSLDDLKRTFGALKMAIGAKLLPIFTTAMEKITKYAGKIKKAYDEKGFAGVWETLVEDFRSIKWPTWDEIKQAVENGWKTIVEGVQGLATTVGKVIFGENVDGSIKYPKWDDIKTFVTTAWETIKTEVSKLGKVVFGVDFSQIKSVGDFITQVDTAWKNLKKTIEGKALEIAKYFFGDNVDADKLADIIRILGDALTAIGTAIVTYGLVTKLPQVIATLKSFFTIDLTGTSKMGLIVSAIAAAFMLIYQHWDEIQPILENIGTWFNDNIIVPVSTFFENLKTWVTTAIDEIKRFFGIASGTSLTELQANTLKTKYANQNLLPNGFEDIITQTKEFMKESGFSDTQIRKAEELMRANKDNAEWVNKFLTDLTDSGEAAVALSDTIDGIPDKEVKVNIVPIDPYGLLSGFKTGLIGSIPGTDVPVGDGESRPHRTPYSNAKGLWDVPYDNYLTYLHRGERILSASQARDYGSPVDLSGLKSEIISAVREGIANATVKAFINGRDVTDEVNRNNMQAVKARRFAY